MLELIIALTVLFLASSFLMGMFAFGSQMPLHAERNALKANLAQQLLDGAPEPTVQQPARTRTTRSGSRVTRATSSK